MALLRRNPIAATLRRIGEPGVDEVALVGTLSIAGTERLLVAFVEDGRLETVDYDRVCVVLDDLLAESDEDEATQ